MISTFDGHNDTVQRLRELHPGGGIDFFEANATGHLDLPRARQGGLFGGLFATFAEPHPDGRTVVHDGNAYEYPMAPAFPQGEALREIHAQLDALHGLAARSGGQVRICITAGEVETARESDALAMVLHMEGAEAISPDGGELEELYARGLRSLGLVWSRPNAFGFGVPFAFPRSPDTGPGLTQAGRELVRACNRRGVLIDLAHLNQAGFFEVARLSDAPLVVSHSAAHALSSTARNLADVQLDAIRASGGLVGVNMAVQDLRADGQRNPETPLTEAVLHFQYLVDRLGVEHVALGTDFDGATIPAALGSAAGLPLLWQALAEAGFDEPALQAMAHGNWLRILRQAIG